MEIGGYPGSVLRCCSARALWESGPPWFETHLSRGVPPPRPPRGSARSLFCGLVALGFIPSFGHKQTSPQPCCRGSGSVQTKRLDRPAEFQGAGTKRHPSHLRSGQIHWVRAISCRALNLQLTTFLTAKFVCIFVSVRPFRWLSFLDQLNLQLLPGQN